MAGDLTDSGDLYSPLVGLIYVFNLIVGTGALTMPKAFSEAGWLLSLILVIVLAFTSYMTVTFMVETMASANAVRRHRRIERMKQHGDVQEGPPEYDPILGRETSQADERSPLLGSQTQRPDGDHDDDQEPLISDKPPHFYEITERIEMADDIAKHLVLRMKTFGPPRILHSDNGKEFNNKDLEDVVDYFKITKINGRPYHPQSQGKVERFNQTFGDYFTKTLQNEKNWPELLDDFYYDYNNRPHSGIGYERPMDKYFKRPNFHYFGEQLPYQNLTNEERNYLEQPDEESDEGGEDIDMHEMDQMEVPQSSQETVSEEFSGLPIQMEPACNDTDPISQGSEYPLECNTKARSQDNDIKVGDKVEFRKEFGIKGLKVYNQAFRDGHVTKISATGNVLRFIVKDGTGAHHYVNLNQIRPVQMCTKAW